MSKKNVLLILFLFISINQLLSQSRNNLEGINKTWEIFYQAFDSLDYTKMGAIHSKDLIRIPGGDRILDYQTYIDNYKRRFAYNKENKIANKISLRFFERINNDSVASERGIYKLIRIEEGFDEQVFYGQFHALLKKENNSWKIMMDYDSTEGESIGEPEYQNAHDINDFDYFLQD